MTSLIHITDCDHESLEIEFTRLEQEGMTATLHQCKTGEEVVAACQEARVLLNQYAPLTAEVLKQLPNLELVVRYGVGVNNIDVSAATELGIQIVNVPDYGTHEVADHALAFMLALTRKIVPMNTQVQNGKWDYQQSIPIYRLQQQTVGVIGMGRIGSAFAEKVHGLGCTVIAYDPKGRRTHSPEFVKFVELDELLAKSDIISIHCPSDTAYHLIGEDALRQMKSSAYLINVSRGGIICEEALHKVIQEGRLAGAALDVSETEPLSVTSPLRNYENVLITPHMAWYSEHSANELKQKVVNEAIIYLKEQRVTYPINYINKGEYSK